MDDVLAKVGNDICLQYIFSSFNEKLDYTGKFLTAVYLQKAVVKRCPYLTNGMKKENITKMISLINIRKSL